MGTQATLTFSAGYDPVTTDATGHYSFTGPSLLSGTFTVTPASARLAAQTRNVISINSTTILAPATGYKCTTNCALPLKSTLSMQCVAGGNPAFGCGSPGPVFIATWVVAAGINIWDGTWATCLGGTGFGMEDNCTFTDTGGSSFTRTALTCPTTAGGLFSATFQIVGVPTAYQTFNVFET